MIDSAAVGRYELGYLELGNYGKTAMTIIYATSMEENALLAYRLDDQSGVLTALDSAIEIASPWVIAKAASGKYLYVAGHQNQEIVSVAINEHGGMEKIGQTPLTQKYGLQLTTYLSVDPSGRYLFFCDYFQDKIARFAIDENGVVNADDVEAITVGSGVRGARNDRQHPHSIQLDPEGEYVMVPFVGKDRIEFYRWQQGQLLSPSIAHVDCQQGTGPRHFAFHPEKPWVYFNNERGDRPNRVTLYHRQLEQPGLNEIDAWQTLPADFSERNAIADIHITPCGRYLYVSNRGHQSLAGFKIDDADGRLTPIGIFPTGAVPTTFAITANGQWLISASLDEGNLSVHRIDADNGSLSDAIKTPCQWPEQQARSLAKTPAQAGAPRMGVPWVVAL